MESKSKSKSEKMGIVFLTAGAAACRTRWGPEMRLFSMQGRGLLSQELTLVGFFRGKDRKEEREEEERGVQMGNSGHCLAGNLIPQEEMGHAGSLLRGIAVCLVERGLKVVTFDMRGAERSTGRASLTGFAEIWDVITVCNWAIQNCLGGKAQRKHKFSKNPICISSIFQDTRRTCGRRWEEWIVFVSSNFGRFESALEAKGQSCDCSSELGPRFFVRKKL